MKNYWFIASFLFSWNALTAQTSDSFSDGDFSANPAWTGSTTHFIINGTKQLQLNNTAAGTSYASTDFLAASIDGFEWQVYVKQNFSPSGSNNSRVYLVSDESDLTRPLNGYYLQFGETGSNDAVELFRQTGTASTPVCRSTNSAIAASFALRVKVVRDPAGLWQLLVDYAGGTDFTVEASGTDNAHTASLFLGFVCVYTVSNATKFYFDDFYAGPTLNDTTPPLLQSVQVHSATAIELLFSEALDQASATSVSHYSIDQGVDSPQSAILQPDSQSLMLTFNHALINGLQYQLTVTGVQDLSGNTMPSSQFPLLFFIAAPLHSKDIVMTEIFSDFSPAVGLPGAEYIEIYNRSVNPVDLSGWKVSDGSSTGVFRSQVILPHQYWIVTSSSEAQFNSFGNAIGISDFPTLNNDGDAVTLKTTDGMTMDSVHYSIDYYHDTDKQEGGWSLELIDPDNLCGEDENWTASEDPSGGTPGKQNSVFASKPDLTGPRLLGIVPLTPLALSLTFNEKLDASAAAVALFQLTPAISISQSSFIDTSLRKIQLLLERPLEGRQVYTVKVGDVRDCTGNLIQEESSQLDFALPEAADSLDLVINELLFNPRPNGVDFIEVYNRSPKYLNLKGWKLANVENSVLENKQDIVSSDPIISPGSYQVFTSDPQILKNNYPQGQEIDFFKTDLPGLPDDEGSIALMSEDGKIIDCFFYSKDFHSGLIKDDEGVSLERISFSNATNDGQNWKSASAQSGFATPGYMNSNARPSTVAVRGTVTIDPEVFIPDTGLNDFAKINYSFEQAGYIANVRIVDLEGRGVKTIVNNETLGFEGFFRWDGDRDDGSRARMGYYVVWVEVFDTSGMVRTYRKRAILYQN